MEDISTLNKRLVEEYGLDSSTGRPIFRIVWADDQTEKRLMNSSLAGVEFIHPVVQEVPKYPYMREMYVLERLVVVPDINQHELPVSKLSYEPVWSYCDANRHYVYPLWNATKFIVDTLYAALGKKSMAKYVDDEKNTTVEGKNQRIAELQKELFSDETKTGDALAYGTGVVVPENYEKDEK